MAYFGGMSSANMAGGGSQKVVRIVFKTQKSSLTSKELQLVAKWLQTDKNYFRIVYRVTDTFFNYLRINYGLTDTDLALLIP